MNDSQYYRFYDDKLDLLYETSVRINQKSRDNRLNTLIRKSRLFLNIQNVKCYRIEPII
ncbi:MAG: hypothetical protein AAF519_02765 [Bacteroidota bacterium]